MKTQIIKEYGYEGYGIYCALMDRLSQSNNKLRCDTETLSVEMGIDRGLLRSIINIDNLFCFDCDDNCEYFYSSFDLRN